MLNRSARVLLVSLAVLVLSGCHGGARRDVWTLPAADLAGTRAAAGSSITARNVHRLRMRWRFGLRGSYASTPVVDATSVYVVNQRGNVFALDRRTGKLEWAHHYNARGGNGLSVDGGRVYGATDDDVFALAEPNGRELWKRRVTSARIAGAPVPWQGLLFVSAIGTIDALDAATGKTRWRFPLPAPAGAPSVSVDEQGRLFVGTSGQAGSLFVLDAATGRRLWHALGAPPLLAGDAVFGAGTSGRVVAWNTTTHRLLWQRAVGPCPGGVVTTTAYADARLFVDACAHGNARIVALAAASGRILWRRQIRTPDPGCPAVANDVVFTSRNGTVDAFATRSGAVLWRAHLSAGGNGCAAVAGDTLYIGGAAIVAFSLPN